MRTVLSLLSLLLLSLPVPAMAGEPPMKVILLGTAGPEYFPDRLGPATLVVAGGQVLLFDCGRGVGQRPYESRVNLKDISRIFLTHLHGDHFDGLPELQGVLAKLTTPEQAARMAQLARPKLMVFSHIVTKDLTEPEAADRIVARTRAAGYAGALVVGEDRMTFELGDTVTMAPSPSLETLVPLDSKDQRFP